LLNDDANGNNVQQQGSQRLPVSEQIPNKATFRLTDDEWKRIKPTYDKPDKLQPSWTYVMARHLRVNVGKNRTYEIFRGHD
jgi:hypothetical protein